MKLFGISNHGLLTIGFLVAILWGVLLVERAVNLQTRRDFNELRQGLPAASQPSPEKPPQATPSKGLAFS
ncbi:MAG: hypothetical protein H6509_13945 [Bryobacterales bacterium]|nr:hypothetical protein [Acidobacteriota bacterium]MCB9385713.1 hypothetical protein [Bryobacterales bacterium]